MMKSLFKWLYKSDMVDIAELRAEISALERENKQLQSNVDSLENRIVEMLSLTAADKPVLDFDIMRVFSIERNVNHDRPCTIIGFFESEPVLSSDGEMIVMKDVHKEWYLYCNSERHQELVDEFKQWKTKQNVK